MADVLASVPLTGARAANALPVPPGNNELSWLPRYWRRCAKPSLCPTYAWHPEGDSRVFFLKRLGDLVVVMVLVMMTMVILTFFYPLQFILFIFENLPNIF
jgi:hypothetical protein